MYAISHTNGRRARPAPQRSAAYPPRPAGAKLREKRVNTAFCGQSDRQAAAYPPQIAGAGRGKPKCGLLRTARQPICGVPAANRQGGEGACSGLSFTILKKIEGDTHFSKILLIFHTESSALFERKYRFLKILKKFSDF